MRFVKLCKLSLLIGDLPLFFFQYPCYFRYLPLFLFH
jgi:hypothetical protein